jgi:probable rRNA maturation factor
VGKYKPKVELKFESDRWLEEMMRADWKQFLLKCVLVTFEKVSWECRSIVSFVFTDDASIMRLNEKYRDQEKPTNVLSFPQLEFKTPGNSPETTETIHIGDVVLAFETILKESILYKLPFLTHLSHLVVHGILHLFGFDHIKSAEAELMEGLEISILKDLNISNPYA